MWGGGPRKNAKITQDTRIEFWNYNLKLLQISQNTICSAGIPKSWGFYLDDCYPLRSVDQPAID